MTEISHLSKEYIRLEVSAKEEGAQVDPTDDGTVEMAFPVTGVDPEEDDWTDASWEVDRTTYYARCLIGPGALELDPATYDVWGRISGINPEIPVVKGRESLTVT